jgi:hypothetical protein
VVDYESLSLRTFSCPACTIFGSRGGEMNSGNDTSMGIGVHLSTFFNLSRAGIHGPLLRHIFLRISCTYTLGDLDSD